MRERIVEAVVKIAALLGFNPVRVRWRLGAWLERRTAEASEAGSRVRHAGYRHVICPHCGALQDGDSRQCDKCGRPVGGRSQHVLHRLGLALPGFVNVSTIIVFLCIVMYARLLIDMDEASSFFQFSGWTLVRYGGNFRALVLEWDEWWRLGTAMFLHGGLIHLLFNMFALAQIGPVVEGAIGRGRFLVLYVISGLVGSGVSLVFLKGGVGIGASGAIMGVIGAGAALGHRLGTSGGLELRNRMLQWALYTMVFGLFVRADNWAHGGGFVAGGVMGLLLYPVVGRVRPMGWAMLAALAACIAAAIWFLYHGFVPTLPVERMF